MKKQKHTRGPVQPAGHTILNNDGEFICLSPSDYPEYMPHWADNARFIAASYNAFDAAALRLNQDAGQLAERMKDGGIAELIEALALAKKEMDRSGAVFGQSALLKIDLALAKAGTA